MRINLRLDWRALALLGALLSCLIAWQGCLVFAMPMSITTISNQQINNNTNNTKNTNNSHSNSTRFSNSNYLKSDHSRSQLVSVNQTNQTTNQSINAEFNQSLNMQTTAIQTTEETTTTTTTEGELESTSQSYEQEQKQQDDDDDQQLEQPGLGFVISAAASASEHLAVLSRTERSIRHQQRKHHHPEQHHRLQQQQKSQQSPSTADNNNFIGSKSKRLNNSRNNLNINSSNSNSNSNGNNSPINNLDRNERSTVPQSHLAWTSRKIQLYIKNRILQLLRDGTVNGTQDEQSEYTILQRSTVDVGRIKLQSVATCLYLCMDACGSVYGSLSDLLQKDFTDDCVFNENMGLQNYNTYSSTYNSNPRRVYYLALNRHGEPRRTQIPASRSLGKLTTYTNAITETVPQERVEQLIAKNFGANRIKHGVRQLCDTGKPLIELIDAANFKKPPECSSSSGSSSNGSSTSGSGSSASAATTAGNNGSSITVPVPAASAGSLISISNSSQSESGHISSSISTSTSNSTSNSSSSSNINSSSPLHPPPAHLHPKQSKKKKLRKCKLHESEELHNCQKRPAGGAGAGAGALRKRGPKAQRCKELRDKAAAEGGPPPNCGKKNGAKKSGAEASLSLPQPKAVHQRPRTSNGQAAGGKKKPPKGGKQRAMSAKKQQARGAALNSGKQRKQRPSTTTTMATSLVTPSDIHWESSSPLPSMALSETSDRVERNVRMSSMEEELDEDEGSLEDASYEDATSEAHARSGSAAAASDDSLYYDFLCLLFLPLMVLQRRML
ncbi:rho GTPase-activating protein gacF isoform X1 [Drosophila subobscura]|uniref:rho GTPase-activating protein gacF isoform X1 n=1 Tax=Drosophila subobscura TaxID=7241 RepID=UPI00155A5E12|nr:rho GTPase-activating protein gacF isoform X1 [Drosophila subobscura]